jgi:hypothetical protein
MSEVLVQAANALAGTRFVGIPLPLALEWAEVHSDALGHEAEGETMFQTLVERMGSGSTEQHW